MTDVDRPARIEPGPGQESVWDYPRPPRIERVTARVRVEHGGRLVADSTRALRVLETSQAPAVYIPAADVEVSTLRMSSARSFCEWKGVATYADIEVERAPAPGAAWTYRDPVPAFATLRDHWSFFPQLVDACFLGDEQARPMDGGVYGGWVTDAVVGPIKGGPGTAHW